MLLAMPSGVDGTTGDSDYYPCLEMAVEYTGQSFEKLASIHRKWLADNRMDDVELSRFWIIDEEIAKTILDVPVEPFGNDNACYVANHVVKCMFVSFSYFTLVE